MNPLNLLAARRFLLSYSGLAALAVVCGALNLAGARMDGSQTAGRTDPLFNPEIDGLVNHIVLQTNGQILVAGEFSRINGLTRKRLARLNPNGSVDTSLAPIVNGQIETLALQPDNKIIASGGFSQINGVAKSFMARLNPDGSFDPSLDAGLDWLSPGWGRPSIQQMVVQPDGKILVAGRFTIARSVPKPGLARLNSDGSLDTEFNVPASNSGFSTIALLPNGKILAGGSFSSELGLARLNSDGSLDSSFANVPPNSYGIVSSIAPLPDGRFFIGSPVCSIGGVIRHGLARFLSNGGLDLTFDPGNQIPSDVYFSLVPASSVGNVIVYNSFYNPMLRRLNSDGSLDTNFVASLAGSISTVVEMSDRSLLAGGSLTVSPTLPQSHLARILTGPTASRDLIEFANTEYSATEGGGQGKIIVRRTGGSTKKVSVDYALLPGTATAGVDFLFTAGTLHWHAKDTSDKAITFQILDDALVEGDESFAVELSSPTGGAALGSRTTAAITIQDNEHPASLRDPSYYSLSATVAGGFPSVYRLGIQPDGKVLIEGAFSTVGGATRPGFARLNTDGSIDPQFNPQISGYIAPFAVQPDGKIVVGGGFGSINGINRTNLARLNQDGSIDPGFNPIPIIEMRAGVIAIQLDGKIIVGTGDGAWNQNSGYVLRLNPNGSRDSTFQQRGLPDPGNVNSIAIQPDGKILLAGGLILVGSDTTPSVIRLNSDGSLDTSFNAPLRGLFYFVTSVALQSDGKIVVTGGIINIEAAPIVRLNPDGSLDNTFRPQFFHGPYVSIQDMRIQPDDKIVIAGRFVSIGDAPRFNVARLNSDGSTDSSFDAGNLAGPDSFTLIYAVGIQADGKVLLGGGLGSVDGQPSSGVIRLLPSNDINTIEFALASASVLENAGHISVTLLREGNSSTGVSVDLNVSGGTATPGRDYSPPPTSLTFAPLEVSKTITIPILDDTFLEPSETIPLTLSNPSGALLNGNPTMIVTIIDDEIPPSNLDTNFVLYPVFLALQPDNKILAGTGGGLVRYLPDGTPDSSFPFILASGINTVVVQPDGKILIGGNFSSVGPISNSLPRSGLARLATDGTVDTSFNPAVDATGLSGLALQSDGKIVLAGVSSLVSTGFTRLQPNGGLDSSFKVRALLTLSDLPGAAVAIQPDGRILIGGNLYQVNSVQRSELARLNPDGSLDPDFAPTIAGGYFTIAGVNSIGPLSDGRIYVGGVFTLVNGVAMNGISRLESDGTLDTTFNPSGGVDGAVRTLLVQHDGRVLVAGRFTHVAGTLRPNLARLNVDGSVDIGFAPALPADSSIAALGQQTDGSTLLGGRFCDTVLPPCEDDYCDDDRDCAGTLRLNPDPLLKLLVVKPQAKGGSKLGIEVFPGRTYVLQASSDLVHWISLATNIPAANLWQFSDTNVTSRKKFYRTIEIR